MLLFYEIFRLSSSGKSTIANKLVQDFEKTGQPVQLLDGDIIRRYIGGLFGYSRDERVKAAKMYTLLANLLNSNGVSVIVAAITAYEENRAFNRTNIDRYFEIYVECPLEVCQQRDVKGLYARRMRGEEQHVIGIDDPFESGNTHDLKVNTSECDIFETMFKIRQFIITKSLNSPFLEHKYGTGKILENPIGEL